MSDQLEELKKKIDGINRRWNKTHKTTGVTRIQVASEMPEAKLISTGNPALDMSLGGGIPEGTIVEFFGAPACGKTTAMNMVAKEVQKLGKVILYYHVEEALKPKKMWDMVGLDEDTIFYVSGLGSGEDGLNALSEMLLDEQGLPNPLIGMILIDSLSALVPAAELTSIEGNGLEGMTIGRQAAMTSKLFRIICGSGWLHEGIIIGIVNQERTQIGNSPLPNTVSGGKAPQYYAKIRIKMSAPKSGYIIGDNKAVVGHTVEYTVAKNNTGYGRPFVQGSYRVIYGKGIDYVGPIVEESLQYGIIRQDSKVTYVVRYLDEAGKETEEKVKGRARVDEFVEANPQVVKSLQELNNRVRSLSQRSNLEYMSGIVFVDGEEVDILPMIMDDAEEDETPEEEIVLVDASELPIEKEEFLEEPMEDPIGINLNLL